MSTEPERRILESIPQRTTYPEELRRAEWPAGRGGAPRVGVGLSGGGIRSATVSLGFFQALARYGLLRHIDYLSTVSGGGYFGAFYGHLIHRRTVAPDGTHRSPQEVMEAVEAELGSPRSTPVGFLRDNGRYLSPNGAGDLLVSGAVALRNWVAVMVVLGSLALLVMTAVVGVRVGLVRLPGVVDVVTAWSGPPWVSPFFLLSGLGLLVLTVPPGWAYWIVPVGAQGRRPRQWLGRWAVPAGGVGVAGALLVLLARGSLALEGAPRWLWALAGFATLAVLTVGRYVLAEVEGRRERRAATEDAESPGPPRVEGLTTLMRSALSRGLTRALVVVVGLLLLAVVDSVGGFIAHWIRSQEGAGGLVVGFYAGLVGFVGALRPRLMALLTRPGADERPSVPVGFVANVAAGLLILAFLGGMGTIPHLVGPRLGLLALGVISALVVLLLGGVWPFVNRSSLHAVYEARLRRAYLGATNPARANEGEDFPPITRPHPGDGLPLASYNPARFGGPVHLINVTVNETVDGRSQVQQRDRKGVGMAVGPAGVSVSRTHHALWESSREGPDFMGWVKGLGRRGGDGSDRPAAASAGDAPQDRAFRVFPGSARAESLDVGQWVAISGAAFSTGLGSRTSLGFSFLAGLFNIRLGYWWGSGVNPEERRGRSRRTLLQRAGARLRRLCPVQWALLDEWLARFPGVARPEWYLSDGGHFENLGGYELVRRRLPFILLCDNEQDPDYRFSGLADLVRKARTDFHTDIHFLEEGELEALMEADLTGSRKGPGIRWVGALSALRRGRRSRDAAADPLTGRMRVLEDPDRSGLSLARAALARVTYPALPGVAPEETGWLLYVKPTLVGDEPPDLTQYHRARPDFPHESTADQFFDEAQWESYRKLGDWMAAKLFAGDAGVTNPLRGMMEGSWRPRVAGRGP